MIGDEDNNKEKKKDLRLKKSVEPLSPSII